MEQYSLEQYSWEEYTLEEYKLEKYTLEKYTLEKYTLEKCTLEKYTLEKYTLEKNTLEKYTLKNTLCKNTLWKYITSRGLQTFRDTDAVEIWQWRTNQFTGVGARDAYACKKQKREQPPLHQTIALHPVELPQLLPLCRASHQGLLETSSLQCDNELSLNQRQPQINNGIRDACSIADPFETAWIRLNLLESAYYTTKRLLKAI